MDSAPPPRPIVEAGILDVGLPPPPPPPTFDAEATCELENAPNVSLQEYADRLCTALVACAGSSATQPGFPPGFSDCPKLIVSRAQTQQVNAACLNACAAYLSSIQQGGPACLQLLQSGPRECAWAVEAPMAFIYCSQSRGRLLPSDAVGQTDGVWCPSDEQCVTILPASCPPPAGASDPVCSVASSSWVCLD